MSERQLFIVKVPRSHVEIHKVYAFDEESAKRAVLFGESTDVNVMVSPNYEAGSPETLLTKDWVVEPYVETPV